MGWSFSYVDIGRKAHIESLTSARHFSEGYELIKHRVVGNNVWQLMLHKPTGRKFITLDLIAKERGGGWGYKGLSEDMGPVEVNCPLNFINEATPVTEADGYAFAWREKVRAYHARRKTAKPVAGMVVSYGGLDYKLVEPVAPRKGWQVVRTRDGAQFRMNANQLAIALRNGKAD